MKKKILVVLFSLACALIFGTFVTGLVHIDKQHYIEAINNPPNVNYIEEDLEETFLTTYVCVLDYDDNEDYVLCKVKANGYYYNVLYRVVRNYLCSYHWEMIKYVEVKE